MKWRAGLLSLTFAIVQAPLGYANSIDPHFAAEDDGEDAFVQRGIDSSRSDPSFMTFLKDPASVLQAPAFDVADLSQGGNVHVSFCSSWSYSGGFRQVKSLLLDKYPNLNIIGTNFPISPAKALLAKVLTAVQMGILLLVVAGDKVLTTLGLPDPAGMLETVQANKFGYGIGIWFVGNMLVSSLSNTGAFEIAFDGQMVFSKLDTGRMPTMQEIFAGIEAIKRNHWRVATKLGVGSDLHDVRTS